MKGVLYKGLEKVEGPIIVLENTADVGFGELVS